MMHYVLNLYQIMTVRRFAPCVSDIKSVRQYWHHCSIPAPLPYANGKLEISTQAVLHRNFSICLNIKGLRYCSKFVIGSDPILDIYFFYAALYVRKYYNTARPHMTNNDFPPDGVEKLPVTIPFPERNVGNVKSVSWVGGFHHSYYWAA